MRRALLSLLVLVGTALPPRAGLAAPEEPLWTTRRAPAPRPVGLPPVVALARGIGPSVVNVSVLQSALGDEPGTPRRLTRGLGTGFVIHRDGYLLTNHHVIEHSDRVLVRLADDREFPAQVVGSDEKTDVALLKIDVAGELAVAPLGDSDAIEIGEWVAAIGNPFGLDHTVTVGIVSGKGRRDERPGGAGSGFYDFIQTDASINLGNSGGPLVNMRGEVIGVNTAIAPRGQGIAFAIPINMVKAILPMLRARHRVVRSWLGATLQPLTVALQRAFDLPDARGALVADVAPRSPAEGCGLVAGDVIEAVDGRVVRRADDLVWRLATAGVGSRVALTVRRGPATRTVSAVLVLDPEDPGEPTPPEERPRASPLGMVVAEQTPAEAQRRGGGVRALVVEPGSPAAEAGLQRDDVLLRVGDVLITSLDDYRRAVNALRPNDVIRVLARRNGRSFWAAFSKR